MNPKKERRRASARHRWTRSIPMQATRALKMYYKDNGKDIPTEWMFTDADGNPLSYSQLTARQKIVKLMTDIECNKALQPYTFTEHSINIPDGYKVGDEWIPCLKQLNKLNKLAIEESKRSSTKTEKKVEEKIETPVVEKKRLCERCRGKGTYFDKEAGSRKVCPILSSDPDLHINPELKLAKWNRRTTQRPNKG